MVTRIARCCAGAILIVALTASAATASEATTSAPSIVSGPSPFRACPVGGLPSDPAAYTNAEVEPSVAVDPVTGDVVAVWQQDRWQTGGARALATGVSSDGKTWNSLFIPWSLCAGGTAPAGDFPRVTDPCVGFGPDGIGYQVALGTNPEFPYNESGITASRSLDGGHTWTTPQVILRESQVQAPFPFNDKESVTADPTRPGYAYAVWDRQRFPSLQEALEGAAHSYFEAYSFRADATLSRTANGGASWEPARSIMPTNAALATIDNQIGVTGDGTLVDVFKYGQGSGVQPANLNAIGALRSTDAGQTWSRIIPIADADSVGVRDPDDGDRVRAFTNLEVAADPTKPATIYAVWADARFSGGLRDDIVFSTSSDAGLTWSTPVKINQTPTTPNPLDGQAFLPAIAVATDGTIGVFYYDFRNNTPDPDTLPTTAYLIHSHDGGQTWQENQLSAAFDLKTAPQSEGYFVGDYQGLAARGNSFLAVFATTNTSLDNRTGITAVSVSP
jgi:Neuraminidase (sialidase)